MTKMAVEMLVYVIRKPAAIGESSKHVKSMALIPAMAEAELLCLASEVAKKSCLNECVSDSGHVYSGGTVVTPTWYTMRVVKNMHAVTHLCVLQAAYY